MFKEFAKSIRQEAAGPGDGIGDQVKEMAAAVLMVEAARGGKKFTPEKRASIKSAIISHFGLDEAAAEALVLEADKRLRLPYADSIFSRAIKEAFPPAERKEILGMVWKATANAEGSARVEQLILEQLGKDMDLSAADIFDARATA